MSIRTSRGPTSRRSIVSGPRGAPARTAPYAGVLCACVPVFDRTGDGEVNGVAVMRTSLCSARDCDEVPDHIASGSIGIGFTPYHGSGYDRGSRLVPRIRWNTV